MRFRHRDYSYVPKPWAIDPVGCGCTECIVGEYVPQEWADKSAWLRVLMGDIDNHTYMSDEDFEAFALEEIREAIS